ncbi:MAG TPA: hypothetical protein VL025_01905, partial [Thermoanaerobaculia bacterium]|nr:hypothetical protein [Thermoanaerobaculia bacterium]
MALAFPHLQQITDFLQRTTFNLQQNEESPGTAQACMLQINRGTSLASGVLQHTSGGELQIREGELQNCLDLQHPKLCVLQIAICLLQII